MLREALSVVRLVQEKSYCYISTLRQGNIVVAPLDLYIWPKTSQILYFCFISTGDFKLI